VLRLELAASTKCVPLIRKWGKKEMQKFFRWSQIPGSVWRLTNCQIFKIFWFLCSNLKIP
jgi:hypothetical protein